MKLFLPLLLCALALLAARPADWTQTLQTADWTWVSHEGEVAPAAAKQLDHWLSDGATPKERGIYHFQAESAGFIELGAASRRFDWRTQDDLLRLYFRNEYEKAELHFRVKIEGNLAKLDGSARGLGVITLKKTAPR